jgi:hypothetical protein
VVRSPRSASGGEKRVLLTRSSFLRSSRSCSSRSASCAAVARISASRSRARTPLPGAVYVRSAAIAFFVVRSGSVALYSGSHCSSRSWSRLMSRVRSLVSSACVRLQSCTAASSSSSAYTRGSVLASSRSSVATLRASRRSLLPGLRIPRRRAAVQRPFTSCTRSPWPARYCARPRPRNHAPSTAQIRCGHCWAPSSSAAQAWGVLGRSALRPDPPHRARGPGAPACVRRRRSRSPAASFWKRDSRSATTHDAAHSSQQTGSYQVRASAPTLPDGRLFP